MKRTLATLLAALGTILAAAIQTGIQSRPKIEHIPALRRSAHSGGNAQLSRLPRSF